jgi:trk system potassium uptake protein
MRILLAGGGSVGRHMASQLAASGHQVTIVDNNRTVVEKRSMQSAVANINWLIGDACDVGALRAAGAQKADVFTAVTGDDEDNLVSALLAKQEFGVPRVIARVNNPRNEWLFTDMWGIDISVSTPHLLASLVEEAVTVGSVVRLLSLQRGRANLLEVTLAPDSPAAGRSIGEVGLPREAQVVAVLRDGHVIHPERDTVMAVGDEVLILSTGNPADHEDLERALIGVKL